jgi:hypothetical protein
MKECLEDVDRSASLDTISSPIEQHSENTAFLLHVLEVCDSDLSQKTICCDRGF